MKSEHIPILNSPILGYAHHRIILDDLGNPVDYEFLEVNATFEKLTGWASSLIVGNTFKAVNHGKEKSDFDSIALYGEVALQGGEKEFEYFSEPLKKWYRVHVYSTEKLCFTTMFVDITDRKRIEADLIANKDQYQSLVNNIPGITYRCKFDKDWTMLFISAQVDSITGYSADELLHNSEISYGILIHDEDKEPVTRVVEEAITNDTPWEIEYRVSHKDGSLRWVYEKGSAIKDESDQVLYLDGFILDITERKSIQDALATSEERYHRALSGAGAGLWDWDIVNQTVFFSKQWKAMLGYEDHEIPNDFSGWRKLWHPDEVSLIEKKVNDHLSGKTDTYEVEHRLLAKDGSWRWILTRGDIEKKMHLDNLFVGQEPMWILQSAKCLNRKYSNSKRLYYGSEKLPKSVAGNMTISIIQIHGVRLHTTFTKCHMILCQCLKKV